MTAQCNLEDFNPFHHSLADFWGELGLGCTERAYTSDGRVKRLDELAAELDDQGKKLVPSAVKAQVLQECRKSSSA